MRGDYNGDEMTVSRGGGVSQVGGSAARCRAGRYGHSALLRHEANDSEKRSYFQKGDFMTKEPFGPGRSGRIPLKKAPSYEKISRVLLYGEEKDFQESRLP